MDTIMDSSLGWMSGEEQAQVRTHPGLEWVFREPDGLTTLRGTSPPAPQLDRMLASVYRRAAGGESRLAAAWPGAASRWAWAAWGSAAVLVVLALMLLPRVIDLTPESAWAMVDGFILEYDMQFEEEYTHSAAAAPDHPLNALIVAVHQWDSRNRDELGGDVSPRTSVDIRGVNPHPPGPDRASLRVLVPGATEELRDDLIQTLAALDGLSEPQRFSQRWYYQEKYPELCVEHRRLIIDGEEYRFPEDFSNDEIDTLLMYLNHCALGGGKMYVAYLEVGKQDRFGLGDVVSFDTTEDGEIEIATYADTLEFAGEGLPAHRGSWWILIPPEEEDLDYDPIELLKRCVDHTRLGQTGGRFIGLPRNGLVVIADLLPARRWLGLTEQQFAREFSTAEQEQARTRLLDIEQAVRQWAELLPTTTESEQSTHEVQPMEIGGVPAQAWITVWTSLSMGYSSDASDLEQRIAAIAGSAVETFGTRERVEVRRETVTMTYPPRIRDRYTLHYDLLRGDTADLFYDEIPGLWSTAEKLQAHEAAARIEAAFNAWVAQYPELLKGRPLDHHWFEMRKRNQIEDNTQYAYLARNEQAGVVRSVTACLYKDDSTLAAELRQALALPGVPEPAIGRPGEPRDTPEWQDYIDNRVGYRIEWEMFLSHQKSRCIEMGRSPEAFTAEERDNARAVLGAIRDGWRDWLAEHPDIAAPEYSGRSVHHAQTQHMAGVPTGFRVQLGVEDEDLLADLLATLDLPSAPQPEIASLRLEREKQQQRSEHKPDSIDLQPVDGYRLVYRFFPQVETMYLTYEQALERFSEEQLESARDSAERLIAAFESWQAAQGLAGEDATILTHVIMQTMGSMTARQPAGSIGDEIVTGVFVELYLDDEQLYQGLRAALADTGVEPAADSGKSRVVKVIRK